MNYFFSHINFKLSLLIGGLLFSYQSSAQQQYFGTPTDSTINSAEFVYENQHYTVETRLYKNARHSWGKIELLNWVGKAIDSLELQKKVSTNGIRVFKSDHIWIDLDAHEKEHGSRAALRTQSTYYKLKGKYYKRNELEILKVDRSKAWAFYSAGGALVAYYLEESEPSALAIDIVSKGKVVTEEKFLKAGKKRKNTKNVGIF